MKPGHVIVVTVLVILFFMPGVALADIVYLKGGGTVEGKVTITPGQVIVEIKKGMSVFLKPEEVLRIEKKKTAAELYQEKIVALADNDSDAMFELGMWCREKSLAKEAEHLFRKVIAMKPDHKGARRALHFHLVDGKWLTREEYYIHKGMVQYKGRWMTPDQKKALQDKESSKEWKKRVKNYVVNILKGKEAERTVAESTLLSIRDPNAAAALRGLLRNSKSSIRLLGATVLAHFPEGKVPRALADAAMKDESEKVREAAAASLGATGHKTIYMRLLKATLYSPNADKRNNALDALVIMKDSNAVRVMIEILILQCKPTPAMASADQRVYIGAGTYKAIAYRKVTDGNGKTFSIPMLGRIVKGIAPRQETRTEDVFNIAMREALLKITGQSLNYEQDKWRDWWKDNKDKIRNEK